MTSRLQKIESRSAATKSNISNMMLKLDETKVRSLTVLTRINSIKNTNYCEDLIASDELDGDDDEVPKKEPVSYCVIKRPIDFSILIF